MFVLPTFSLGVIASQTITIEGFFVDTESLESTITASTPTNPTGEVTIKYSLDQDRLYIWNGNYWYGFKRDSSV